MMYYSQGLGSHKFIKRTINISGDATIVDLRNFMQDLYVECFIRHSVVIGRVDHVVETDESGWTKRKYNRGRRVGAHWVFGEIDKDTRECYEYL